MYFPRLKAEEFLRKTGRKPKDQRQVKRAAAEALVVAVNGKGNETSAHEEEEEEGLVVKQIRQKLKDKEREIEELKRDLAASRAMVSALQGHGRRVPRPQSMR